MLYRLNATDKLNRGFLRINSTHRLVDRRIVSKDRAIELLMQRRIKRILARAMVELWLANPPQRELRPISMLGRHSTKKAA